MSDPNKFINTYIDTIMATLHEQLGSSLQLKTQLKLANDLLIERDATIAQLIAENETIKNNVSSDQETSNSLRIELASCQDRLKIAEESHDAIKVKLSHMDTLLNQISEMKREIISNHDAIADRDNQIADLKMKLEELKNPPIEVVTPPAAAKTETKSSSNAVSSSTVKLNKVKTTKTKAPDDDF